MAGKYRGARDQKRDLFDRWLAHRDDTGRPDAAARRRPGAEPPAPPRPAPTTPEAEQSSEPPQPSSVERTAGPPAATSTNVEFEPRTANRRLVGEILLVVLLLTALATYFAVTEPTTLTIGLAGVLGVLLLVLWGIRAGAPNTRMRVVAGQLIVVQSGKQTVYDLTSAHTPIDVVGQPRERGWKVLFHRPDADPFVVDSAMVDPEHFMQVLRRHRPQ